jgi:hypothetical protein
LTAIFGWARMVKANTSAVSQVCLSSNINSYSVRACLRQALLFLYR